MRLIKKCFVIFLAIVLVTCNMPSALSEVCVVSCVDVQENLKIPAYDMYGNAVTRIGEKAFYNVTGMHTVIVPSTIDKIDEKAFAKCTTLYAMVIPETVTTIADDAFNGVHYIFTIITPKGSYAASFAQRKGINCVQLPQSRIKEADELYISTMLFKLNFLNSRFFSMSEDKDDYLGEISSKWDYWMLGANNRGAALSLLLDLFVPGNANSYMSEKYAEQIGNILNDMKEFKPTQINTDILTKPAEAISTGYKGYIELVTWLNNCGLPPDDPFVQAVMDSRNELESFAETIGTYTDVTNFILYYLTDYSDAVEMLDILQEMSTQSTFSMAVHDLKVDYDSSVAGVLNKGIQEILLPKLLSVAKKAAKEAYPVLGLYSLATKALDIALKVSGSKEFRDNQLTYISLLEICMQAESYCRGLFNSSDHSVESIRKLQMACEFYRVALCRLYKVQRELFTDKNDKKNAEESLKYYENASEMLFSQYRHKDLDGRYRNDNTLIFETKQHNLSDTSLGSVEQDWQTSSFWDKYPDYEPYAGPYYATTSHTEDWKMYHYVFSAGCEPANIWQDTPLYKEAALDSGIVCMIEAGSTVYVNGEYSMELTIADGQEFDELGYDYNAMVRPWYLVWVIEEDRHGWIPYPYVRLGQ